MVLRKSFLLFGLLVNCFVGCSNVNAQTDQFVQTEQVIQDKTSLQNIAYYSVFTLFFITFAIWISKKSKWPYFKYFVAYNSVVLLASTIYHTAVYGKRNFFHMAFDQEGFYFPQKCKDYCQNKSFKELLTQEWNCIKNYEYINLHYYIFYRFIRDVLFPEKNFFAAFYFAGTLNACLWLVGLFLLVEIFLILKCKMTYIILALILLCAQFDFLLRNGITLANSMESIMMIFFLWCIVKRINVFGLFLCCFGFYFSHKIYYLLPFVLFISFLIFYKRENWLSILSIMLIGLLCGIFLWDNPNLAIMRNIEYAKKCRMMRSLGNSKIPQTEYRFLRLCNSWFAPLICNFNKVLAKAPKGSMLGLLVAVFWNVICIVCVFSLIYHLIQGQWRFFSEEDKRVIYISLTIIAYLTIAFASVSNYLNLLRHRECVMSVWYVLLGCFYKDNSE